MLLLLRIDSHLMAVLTQNPAEGAFQHYALAKGVATASLQDGVSLLDASVLPLALSTATVALYTPKQLSLELPSPTLSSKAKDEYVLVWGGSSSVGSIAIQLLRFSGYRVATTCSPRNTEYVKELGAELVFDHSSATVVKDITTALDARPLIGAFNAVGDEKSSIACVAIVHANQSPTNKKHVATTGPVPVDVFEGANVLPLGSAATMFFDEDRKEIARYIWQDFLSIALTKGFRPAPEPLVVGNGLESVSRGSSGIGRGSRLTESMLRCTGPESARYIGSGCLSP